MLTLAMVIKHEAKTLINTIETVGAYADEIVIGLDVKSNDGTRDLLETIDCKVVDIHIEEELACSGPVEGGDGDWGFSRARNLVADACSPDNWILFLDGHELVKTPEKIKPVIETAIATGCDGVECLIVHNKISYGFPRLIGPGVRHKRPLHNIPACKCIYSSHSVIIERRKQDQDPRTKRERDSQRAVVNIAGFQKLLSQDGTDARNWFYLATAHKDNGQYCEAVEAFKKCLEFSRFNEERWHARIDMGTCYSFLARIASIPKETFETYQHKARDQFVMAIDEFPAMAEAYYYLGDMSYKQERYHEAQVWLEKCVELGRPFCKLFVDSSIYNFKRHDRLAMTYDHLGQYGRAIEQGQLALQSGPDVQILKNIGIWTNYIRKHGAEHYDKRWSGDRPMTEIENQRVSFMVESLGPVNSVLDVGCGTGWPIQFLRPFTSYTGVDISAKARECVISKQGDAVASLKELNGKEFDGCILGEFLEHTEDDVATLKEIVSHLKLGATIIASVPRYAVMRDPAHTRDYTETEFMRLMSTVGEATMLNPIGPWMLCMSVV